jgi:DNA-binding beta-propeller fold protein YncE
MQRKSEKRTFYALAEGKSSNEDGEAIAPAILELRLTARDRLHLVDQIHLPGDPTVMSSHHADFHPDGQHIYVGSSEGHLFVIDRDTKSIISTIETGLGTGHTRFVPAINLAIVTNHHDTFVTVIDTESHSKVKDIAVSGSKTKGEILQSHTNYVSPDSNFYYAFASDNGTFFELNLKKLKIGRTLHTGGVPVQGSFINWDDFSYSAVSSSSGM